MTLVRFESLPIEYRASQRQSLKFTLFMLPEWQLLQSFLQQYLETSSFPRVSMTFTELQWGSIQTLRLMAFPLVSSNSSTTQLLRYVPEVLDFIQFRWGVNIPSQATRMSAYAHGHLPSLPFEYLIHLPLHMQVHLHDPKLSSKEPVMELSAHLFMSSCQNEALADVHLHFFNSSQVQARWREFFSPESSTMIVVNGIRLNPRPTTEETKPWMSMQWSSILKVLSKSSLDSILQLPQHINVYTLPNGIQIDTLLQPSMFPYLQSISWASVSALVQLVGSNAAAQVQILPGHLQGSQSDDISPSEKTISIQFSFVDLSFGTSTSFWTDEPWGIQLSHLKIGEIHSFSKAEVIHQFTFPTSEPNKFEEWSTFLRDIQIEFHSKLPKLTLSIDLVRPSLPFSWSLHLPSQWKVFLQTNGDRFSTPFILVQSELKCQSDQPSPILIDVWISQEPTVQLALATLMDQFLHSKQPDIKFSIAGLQFGRSKIFKKMELVSTHLTSLNSLRSTFTHSSLPRKPEGIRLTRLASAPSTLQLEFDLTLPVNDWHLSRIAFPNIRFWLKFQHQRLLPIFIPAFDVDPMTKMTFAIQLEMDNIQLHPVQQLLDKLPGVIPNSYLGLEDVQVGVMKAFQKITFDERVVLPSDQGHAPFPLQNVEFQEIPSGLEMQAELHLPWGLTTLLDVSTLFPLSIHVKRSSTTLLLAQWHTLTLQSPFILHFRVSLQAPELSSTTSLKDMNQFVNEIITHTGLASFNVTGLTLGAAAPTPIRSLQSLHFVTSINSFSDTPSNKSCPFQPAVRPPSLPLPPSDPTLINRATTFFIRMSEDGLPGFDISIRSFFPFQMKWLKSPLVIKKISLQLQLNNHDFVHVSLSEFTLSGKLNALVAPTLYVRFGTSEPLQKDLSKLVLEVLSYLRRTTEEFHFTQFNVGLTEFKISSFQTWKSVHAILPLDSILPKVLCELHPFFVIDSLYALNIFSLVATIRMPINIGMDLENIKTYLYLSGTSSGEIKIPKVYKKIGDAFSIVDSDRISHGNDDLGLLSGGFGFLHSRNSYSTKSYGSLKGIFFENHPSFTTFSKIEILL
ncbi:hypothetical protein HMI56_007531 [Coelomomyces lativittatus]|nr:hypothetical protein HMI56_007531 [Coelomomyces lativittatus]